MGSFLQISDILNYLLIQTLTYEGCGPQDIAFKPSEPTARHASIKNVEMSV